jgi:hypothetical protein
MTTATGSTVTVLTERVNIVNAIWDDARPVVAVEALPDLVGWELRPEGLCRSDACVPLLDREMVERPGGVDLVAAAAVLGRPAVVDADAGLTVIGAPADERHGALYDRIAPNFTLPDLDGAPCSLSDWSGRKRLLVAFASW